ncbi:hypothetical protein [Amycolatopsis sp. VC5-11]|uniref:hypothetical protein n=1 Tax=Amycolatopsis sp. VC5-11 TaxID=3120156 RepID=UPI00300B7FBB
MNPVFISALISVITATVVTLAIEFVAKPRLEARKDRIVSAHRDARTLRASLAELGHQLFDVRMTIRSGKPPVSERAKELASLAQTAHRLAVSAESAFPRTIGASGLDALRNVRHYCDLVVPPSRERFAADVMAIQGFLDSADREYTKAKQLYSMPRWKVWRRKATITATYEVQEIPPLKDFNG